MNTTQSIGKDVLHLRTKDASDWENMVIDQTRQSPSLYDFVGLDPDSYNDEMKPLSLTPGQAVAVHRSLFVTAEGSDGNLLFEWMGSQQDELVVGDQKVVDVCHAKIGTVIRLNGKRYMVMKSAGIYTPHQLESAANRELRLKTLLGDWSVEALQTKEKKIENSVKLTCPTRLSSLVPADRFTWRSMVPASVLFGAAFVLGIQFLWNADSMKHLSSQKDNAPSISSTITSSAESSKEKLNRTSDKLAIDEELSQSRKKIVRIPPSKIVEPRETATTTQSKVPNNFNAGGNIATAENPKVSDAIDPSKLATNLPEETITAKKMETRGPSSNSAASTKVQKIRKMNTTRGSSSPRNSKDNHSKVVPAKTVISTEKFLKARQRFEEAILIRDFDPDLAQQILSKLQGQLPKSSDLYRSVTNALKTYR